MPNKQYPLHTYQLVRRQSYEGEFMEFLWNVRKVLRMTPNPHLTCLYLFTGINSYTMVYLLDVFGSSLRQRCEDEMGAYFSDNGIGT